MSSRRTGIVRRELRAWDTDVVCGPITDGASGLTNAVGVCTVIPCDGAVLKTSAGVASTRHTV